VARQGVTRAERQMVELAVALVDGSDARLIAPRLLRELPPSGLDPTAMTAIGRVLSRGVARQIVQGGGPAPWRSSPPLQFGSASLDLLAWLYATPVASTSRRDLLLRSRPTPAEGLLLSTVAEWLGALGADPPAVLVRNPWVWLLAGAELATRAKIPEDLDYNEIVSNGWMVDALAPRLKASLLSWNRTTRASAVPETTQHGEAHETLYGGLLGVLPVRRAAFVADALIELAKLPPEVWEVPRGSASISQWQRARRARVALLRVASAWLTKLEQRLRSVGFVDDGFDEAQRQLRQFEDAFIALRRVAPALLRSEELPV
jgi:hypothetical protein